MVVGLVAIGAALAFIVVMADDGDAGSDAADAGTTPTPTPASDDTFGKAPAMTAHVLQITPEHASRVQQKQTAPSRSGPAGICAKVSYQDLPENNQWFQMAVDEKIVTPELTLFLEGTEQDPTGATICYAPKDGLSLGVHSAAVAVISPRNLSGPPQELVGWKFEVIE
jgi:hypothetical protein